FESGGVRFGSLGPGSHGREYARPGGVTRVVGRGGGRAAFITSDVMGPEIEDYAEAVASARPDAVILDGPPTYLFPFMLNRINLERAVENATRIVEAEPELVVYDHHLLRERRWRERVHRVFAAAEREGVTLTTAAEVHGSRPLIDTL
ncbi:MAG: MBL fold metallo-hydrolase, partial [Candidatus Korarchaeota archaeon]|nr:MBL fold metallo-hydrolase [Candidatus Korarchaeota archaeon]